MKKHLLGTFYGQKMFIESDIDRDFPTLYTDWLESERKNAVREAEDNKFIKELENKSKEMENTIWYKVGKKLGFDR